MKVVTVATHSFGYFPILQESCKRHKIDLVVLGWGEKWTGWQFKFQKIKDYLVHLQPNEWFIFIDAYDVLAFNDYEILQESINHIDSLGYDMIVSTEVYSKIQNIYNSWVFGIFDGCNICSGLYATKKERLQDMFQYIGQKYDIKNGKLDDQMLLIQYLNEAKNPNKIFLDKQSEIFFNVYLHQINPTKTILPNNECINPYTKRIEKPVFLHFPANQDFKYICVYLGYDVPIEVKVNTNIWSKLSYQKNRIIVFSKFALIFSFIFLCFFMLVFIFFWLKETRNKK